VVSIQRQEFTEQESRRDLKWNKGSQNGLRLVKSEEDLRENLENVLSLEKNALKRVITSQRTTLGKYPWPEIYVEAWSFGGYISVISRLTLSHYISFLNHLIQVSLKNTWETAQKEIDHYHKAFTLIRTNAPSRLVCMCRIYILLRDSHDTSWRTHKLEAEKLTELFQQVQAMDTNGGGTGTASGSKACSKCSTILHGSGPCPWSDLTNTKAKKAARDMMRGWGTGDLPKTKEEE
jgi:hypothetical protein